MGNLAPRIRRVYGHRVQAAALDQLPSTIAALFLSLQQRGDLGNALASPAAFIAYAMRYHRHYDRIGSHCLEGVARSNNLPKTNNSNVPGTIAGGVCGCAGWGPSWAVTR